MCVWGERKGAGADTELTKCYVIPVCSIEGLANARVAKMKMVHVVAKHTWNNGTRPSGSLGPEQRFIINTSLLPRAALIFALKANGQAASADSCAHPSRVAFDVPSGPCHQRPFARRRLQLSPPASVGGAGVGSAALYSRATNTQRGAGVLSFSVWWPKPANAQQVRAHQPYSYGECTMPESRVQFRHAPRFCLFGLEFSSLDSSCLRMPECAPAAQFNHTASENGAFNAVSAHGLLCSALRHGLRHCWASVNLCRARSGGRCVSALLPPLIVCFPLARSSSARRARRRRKLPS